MQTSEKNQQEMIKEKTIQSSADLQTNQPTTDLQSSSIRTRREYREQEIMKEHSTQMSSQDQHKINKQEKMQPTSEVTQTAHPAPELQKDQPPHEEQHADGIYAFMWNCTISINTCRRIYSGRQHILCLHHSPSR
jgi:hypothetical protein